MNEIGKTIKEFRKNKKMTQKQLGELIGVSSITIQNYENNRRAPNNEIMQELGNVLGFTVNKVIVKTESIGEKIRNIRLIKNLSIRDLGELSCISKTSISDIENNKVNPTINTLTKLSQALNINLNTLMQDQQQADDYIKNIILAAGGNPSSFTNQEYNELKESIINYTKFKIYERGLNKHE